MPNLTRRQQIEAMLADEPNDPELRYLLAMEHASEGNDAEAARHFQELVDSAPQYPPAYHMGAKALARLQRMEEAKAMLQRGIPAALGQGNTHAAGEMEELLASLD